MRIAGLKADQLHSCPAGRTAGCMPGFETQVLPELGWECGPSPSWVRLPLGQLVAGSQSDALCKEIPAHLPAHLALLQPSARYAFYKISCEITEPYLCPGGGYRLLFSANFGELVLGYIRIRIRSRSVFEKKENLGVYQNQNQKSFGIEAKFSKYIVNTRWKALDEIYTMHSFAQLCNLKILSKFSKIFAKFCKIRQN